MKKLKLFILAVGAAAMMLACSRQKEDKTVNEETTVEETTDFLDSIVKVTAIPYGKKEITDKQFPDFSYFLFIRNFLLAIWYRSYFDYTV